ncbi:choice-of-anchor D domain-containing protein, partial [candidate division KSB1 bacterium]
QETTDEGELITLGTILKDFDSMALVGRYGYFALGEIGLRIDDLSNNWTVSEVKTIPGSFSNIEVKNNYLYVRDADLRVYNITDPVNPELIGTYNETFHNITIYKNEVHAIKNSDPNAGVYSLTIDSIKYAYDMDCNFERIDVDSDITSNDVEFQNLSGQDITLSNTQIDNADFSLGFISIPIVINPDSTAKIPIEFRPSSEGKIVGTLVFDTDLPDLQTINIQLSGYGHLDLTSSASSYDFGEVEVGKESSWNSFTITNPSSIPVNINIISFSNPKFSTTITDFPVTIQPQSSLSIPFTFSPDKEQTEECDVGFGGAVSNMTLSGSGKGFAEITKFSAIQLRSLQKDLIVELPGIEISNTSDQLLILDNIQFSGSGSISNMPTLPVEIDGDNKYSLNLNYVTSADGEISDVITLQFNSDTFSREITITGMSYQSIIELPFTEYNFGEVSIGESGTTDYFTLKSSTQYSINIDSIVIDNKNYTYENIPDLISPQDSSNISSRIIYSPSTANDNSAVLSIYSQGAKTATSTIDLNGSGVAGNFILYQNYPNPFNNGTTIKFVIPEAGDVHAVIYNTLGGVVRSFNPGAKQIGVHEIKWDGRDDLGRMVSSGVYILRFRTGRFTGTQKLVYTR